MIEQPLSNRSLSMVADVVETHVEEIFAAYESRLRAADSPLLTEGAREQLRAQARAVLEDVVHDLRGQRESSKPLENESRLSATVGVSRAQEGVHPSESLRAVVALSEATLLVLADNLLHSRISRSEIVTVALIIQKSILERVSRASVSYGDYLLGKLHESHADERRRIGRELHDRVAHSIMVAFRNLELYEVYRKNEPSEAERKLELAKRTAQEALETTRNLSKELRESSTEEGLEVALSEYLRLIVPPEVMAWVSVKGDESLIAHEVRDELFLILREAIRNAVAHSGAQRIRIELSTSQDRVRAIVEDDGCGFESEGAIASSGGTGLASMKERTSILGGIFSLTSGPENSTKIEILVPLPRSGR